MNILSHAFVARHSNDDNCLLGTSLPDLLPMYNRKLRVTTLVELLKTRADEELLLAGVEHHLRADQYFHTSDFFLQWQRTIREQLQLLPDLSIKRFFLAHILFEMMLDRFLLINYPAFIEHYYQIYTPAVCQRLAGLIADCYQLPASDFHNFLDRFNHSRFLYHYRDLSGLVTRAAAVITRVNNRTDYANTKPTRLAIDAREIDQIAALLAELEPALIVSAEKFFAIPIE